jgi:hypothetical protein
MYGECNDENVCTATSHYRCPHCKEELCWWHRALHSVKHAVLGCCYAWRHQL